MEETEDDEDDRCDQGTTDEETSAENGEGNDLRTDRRAEPRKWASLALLTDIQMVMTVDEAN